MTVQPIVAPKLPSTMMLAIWYYLGTCRRHPVPCITSQLIGPGRGVAFHLPV